MIDREDGLLSIEEQCDLLGLKRSTYYYQPKGWSPEDLEVMRVIDEIYTEHPYYGMRRMSQALKAVGYDVGRKGVRSYYATLGLCAIYPKLNLSKRNHAHKVYPYLLRGLKVSRVNQVWSTDITYIRLNQGFVYLAAVIDWYSRCILSWRISTTLESDFCVEALQEALGRYGQPEIFNTDQGVQFTSASFIDVLQGRGIKISMDGKGRALDNIFIERFWRSLKQEKIYRMELNTVRDAKTAIAEYMHFYNTQRVHQSLNYQTPQSVYLSGKNCGYVHNSNEFYTSPQQQQLDMSFLNKPLEDSISF
jgi:putative transposase